MKQSTVTLSEYLTLLLSFWNITLRLLRGSAGFSTGDGESGSDSALFSAFFSTRLSNLVSISAFIFTDLSQNIGCWLKLECCMRLLCSGEPLDLEEVALLTGVTLSWGADLSSCSQSFFSTLRFPDRKEGDQLSTDWEEEVTFILWRLITDKTKNYSVIFGTSVLDKLCLPTFTFGLQ